jgi:transcriptional regulator with XRE-family HTH domain
MQQISDNIKKFRELKNFTREQLAAELNMSLSGYSKLERGKVELTISKLYRIAEVLEVSPSQILNFDASRVFHISNNNVVNGVEIAQQHIHHDDYKDKYIAMLEEKIAQLAN